MQPSEFICDKITIEVEVPPEITEIIEPNTEIEFTVTKKIDENDPNGVEVEDFLDDMTCTFEGKELELEEKEEFPVAPYEENMPDDYQENVNQYNQLLNKIFPATITLALLVGVGPQVMSVAKQYAATAFVSYVSALKTAPLLTKAVTGGVTAMLGDVMA